MFIVVQPVISVSMSDRNHKACVTVYSPQRIMHHVSKSKFELCNYKYVVETENGEVVDLGSTSAEFSEQSSFHVFTLPPQARKMAGELKVGAVYGDGREEFSGPIKVELPYYGK